MKNTLVSITIFIILVFLCFTSRYLLNKKFNSYLESFRILENSIQINNWETSREICNNILSDFQENSVFVSFIVTNELVETIMNSLENTLFYLKQENKEAALFSCNESKLYIEIALYIQKITVKNIF
ncbi:DUF4363 family protein [Clostridium grantii]|uniref:DUF4363 domain-containing protein n=1 Tax=Clostridium grantii DSM 8605 TaxID=1121316 RepID=A0A1M5RSM7_9CLOT|nr:DUF4363 family protein [Clostridium grantii]SHH29275.1 protein of unknown function [Clostridium grantii DSM 8605]